MWRLLDELAPMRRRKLEAASKRDGVTYDEEQTQLVK